MGGVEEISPTIYTRLDIDRILPLLLSESSIYPSSSLYRSNSTWSFLPLPSLCFSANSLHTVRATIFRMKFSINTIALAASLLAAGAFALPVAEGSPPPPPPPPPPPSTHHHHHHSSTSSSSSSSSTSTSSSYTSSSSSSSSSIVSSS